MMSVFNESIDEAIRVLLNQMDGFPVAVCSREFMDGYRAYYQNESVDFYSLVLPNEAPQRHMGKIDDDRLRPQLGKIFAAVDKVIQAVKAEEISLGSDGDKADSDAFDNAVKRIMEYEKFQCADRVESGISIPPALECYYDKDERLIDVTSFDAQREAFVEKDSRLAVIPKYKSAYGLKEKFAQLFQNGIPDNWCVYVAPDSIIAEKDVPRTRYVQEGRIFGPSFNEAAFRKIFSRIYGEFQYLNNEPPDRLLKLPLYKLQYQIVSNDKEGKSSAIIEELIDIDYGPSVIDLETFVYGSSEHYYVRHRMVHLMYDLKKSTFMHIDLSHLYYNKSDYLNRRDQTLGKIKPHATKKIKVYKIDGEIPFDVISDLIWVSLDGTHNPEVKRLLDGE